MLTNLAFVFICVRTSSALVRTSAFLQPVVCRQVYIFLDFATPDHDAIRAFSVKTPYYLYQNVFIQLSLQ